jgi:hypothetical protein
VVIWQVLLAQVLAFQRVMRQIMTGLEGRSSKSGCCRTLAKQPKLGFVLKKKSEMQGEHHKSNSSGSSV